MKKIVRKLRFILHEMVVSFTPRFMRKHILSCEQVIILLNSKQKISMAQKFKLKTHMLICQCCVDYNEQMSLISQHSKQLSTNSLNNEQCLKIKQSKKDILDSLK
ncbi:MAG: hypothetical protein HON90_07420 [Halobacteriovoraceae bacterium]|jgi:hypothetical protein|nr:hypothetical protein [Halobacteriovoraceae bacterium]